MGQKKTDSQYITDPTPAPPLDGRGYLWARRQIIPLIQVHLQIESRDFYNLHYDTPSFFIKAPFESVKSHGTKMVSARATI